MSDLEDEPNRDTGDGGDPESEPERGAGNGDDTGTGGSADDAGSTPPAEPETDGKGLVSSDRVTESTAAGPTGETMGIRPRSSRLDGIPPALAPALSMLADGLLAGLLAVLLIRSFLPPRPLALPTGASSAGVVLLGVLAFVCGTVLSVRGKLVERGPRWPIDGLLAGGTVLVASLVVLPVLGVDLPSPTLALGVLGIGLLLGAVVLALSDYELLARRGAAVGLDGVLEFALWYGTLWGLLPALGIPAPTGASWGEVIGALLLIYLCSAIVRVPFEAFDGRSIGKRLAGVRVVDRAGDSPGVRAVLVRNLLRPVDSLPLGYVVGIVFLAASETDARIGDVLAETRVERDGDA